MSTWLKILLFVVGGVFAATGTAYLTGALDPWMEPEAPIVASLPDQDARPLPEAKPAAVEEEEAVEPAEAPAAAEDEGEVEHTPAAEGDDIVVPGFDIVRVTPEGSMVIAGHAAPEANVEVVTGTRVLAEAQADAGGDFAAVLDDPLAPGDYQIVLRATTQDNVVATSVETAVVSIPETADGQVLALVEQPGSPSRLITVPQPVEPAAEVDVAKASEPAEEEAAASEVVVEEEPAEIAEAEAIEVPDEAVEQETAEIPAEPEAAEEEIAEVPAEAVEEEVAEAPGEAVEEEVAEALGEAVEEPAVEQAEAGEEQVEAEQEIAALPEAEPAEPEASAIEARVFVEAVEIDGDTVFVAGRAEAGRFIRVYANEIVLGETRSSPGGRFLVEATVDLPVGDYIIRADLLGGDGSVIARAAVPFEREPGEAIAAVAPVPGPAEVEAEVAEEPADEAPVDIAEADDVLPEAETAMGEGAVAEGEVEIAISEEPAESEVVASDPEPAVEEEAEAPSVIADEPAIAEEPEEAMPEPEAEVASEIEEAMPEPEVADTAAEPEAEEVAAAPVEETLSPALERADGAVIIRRGDNLWRISRRVYGHGIRYSTIYLANQEQIRNPDLIWPGQVFNVPAETDQGEMADLEALGEQAVDPSMVPGEIEIYR